MAKRSTLPIVQAAGSPDVPLVIDGVTWHLRFDFNAIAEAEKVTGINLMVGYARSIISGMDAGQIRGLLYAAIRTSHEQATVETAGRLIRLDTMPDIQAALTECYLAAMPEKKRQEFEAYIQAFRNLQIPTSGESSGQPEGSSSGSRTETSAA